MQSNSVKRLKGEDYGTNISNSRFKESLTRALQEVKLAKLEGRKLPDARDLLKDLEMED